jgi:hypothetical protein
MTGPRLTPEDLFLFHASRPKADASRVAMRRPAPSPSIGPALPESSRTTQLRAQEDRAYGDRNLVGGTLSEALAMASLGLGPVAGDALRAAQGPSTFAEERRATGAKGERFRSEHPNANKVAMALALAGPLAAERAAPAIAKNLGRVMGSEAGHVGPLYHGSPHKWDRPDFSKIGTGEGAQAYGHGMYWAESPGTAKFYRDKLSHRTTIPGNPEGGSQWVVSGAEFPLGRSGHQALDTASEIDLLLASRQSGSDEMAEYIQGTIERRIARWRQAGTHSGSAGEDMSALVDFYENHVKGATREQIVRRPGGFLYGAELPGADPADFLDWDKPLSQQSEKVRKALEPLLSGAKWEPLPWPQTDHALKVGGRTVLSRPKGQADIAQLDGATIYSLLGGGKTAGESSARLHGLGIKGVRYLDQGSRSAGQGTANYVLFSDEGLNILSREQGKAGLGTLGLAGGAAGGGLAVSTMQRDKK